MQNQFLKVKASSEKEKKMTRFHTSAFWGVAVCALGTTLLIVAARAAQRTQAPPTDPTDPIHSAHTDTTVLDGASPKAKSPSETQIQAYAVQFASPRDIAKAIETQFAGRFRMVGRDDRASMIFVESDAETQAEIRDVIRLLERAASSAPAGTEAPSSDTASDTAQHDYLGLAHLHQPAGQERIQVARQKLSDAQTDEEKNTARAELRQLLANVFVIDMQAREKHAAEIESRLARLRKQYQEREAAKDKIIDLQLQVIEADAAGLGFPGASSPVATPSAPVRSSGYSDHSASKTPSRSLHRSRKASRNAPTLRADQSKGQSGSAMRVPEEATAEMVTVRDMLAVKPDVAGVDCDQPAEKEIDACCVALEPGAAWSLLSRGGVVLRRFEDTNRDGVVDSWRYYKAGTVVYRDIDSDHDGKIDRHEKEAGADNDGPDSKHTSDLEMIPGRLWLFADRVRALSTRHRGASGG